MPPGRSCGPHDGAGGEIGAAGPGDQEVGVALATEPGGQPEVLGAADPADVLEELEDLAGEGHGGVELGELSVLDPAPLLRLELHVASERVLDPAGERLEEDSVAGLLEELLQALVAGLDVGVRHPNERPAQEVGASDVPGRVAVQEGGGFPVVEDLHEPALVDQDVPPGGPSFLVERDAPPCAGY